MKKIILLAVITGSVLIFAAIGMAQSEQPQEGKMGHMGHMIDQKMKNQDQTQTRCPICAKAMASMMGKAMLPTDDGGVIVMIANKLYKYDQNLDLKNETELPFDYENMKQMMMKMHHMDPTDSQNKESQKQQQDD